MQYNLAGHVMRRDRKGVLMLLMKTAHDILEIRSDGRKARNDSEEREHPAQKCEHENSTNERARTLPETVYERGTLDTRMLFYFFELIFYMFQMFEPFFCGVFIH